MVDQDLSASAVADRATQASPQAPEEGLGHSVSVTSAASLLDGREYREEMTSDEEKIFRKEGLVAVFGASDDLMEFRGAIAEEMGAYDGTTAFVDCRGVLPNRDDIEEDELLEEFFARKKKARAINALWCKEPEYSWTFATDIPHATFEIVEDGEPYCRGIVFALADAEGASA